MVSDSVSELGDTVLLKDPLGEGNGIQIAVELNRMVHTPLKVWKSSMW